MISLSSREKLRAAQPWLSIGFALIAVGMAFVPTGLLLNRTHNANDFGLIVIGGGIVVEFATLIVLLVGLRRVIRWRRTNEGAQ